MASGDSPHLVTEQLPPLSKTGSPRELNMNVVVVGRGILGTAVGARLAAAGCSVTLVGGEAKTTALSLGWLNAFAKTPSHYADFSMRSMALWRGFAEALEMQSGALRVGGCFMFATDSVGADTLAKKVQNARDRNCVCQTLSPEEVAKIVPELRIEPTAAALFPEDMVADGDACRQSCEAYALGLGARVLDDEVLSVTASDNTVTIQLKKGETLQSDYVVLAAGGESAGLAQQLGTTLQTKEIFGMQVRLPLASPLPERCAMVKWFADGTDVGTSLVTVGSEMRLNEPCVLDEAEDLAGRRLLESRKLFPIPEGDPVDMGATKRTVPYDGLPVCGFLPTAPRAYTIFSHSGVTLAPLLSLLAACEILAVFISVDGLRLEELAHYRPERFEQKSDDSHVWKG